MRHARNHHPDAQAEEVVELAHGRGIAARQVIVDRHHMHALAGQRIQIDRQGRDQGFAFAGAHFGDTAGVQHHAADQLDIVMAQAEGADGGLAADREGLGQELVEGFTLFKSLLEFVGFCLEGRVIERFQTLFQLVDAGDVLLVLAQDPLVATAEKFGKQLIEHG